MKTVAETADFAINGQIRKYAITIKQLVCLITGIYCRSKARWRTAAVAKYMCLKTETYGDH